MKIAVLYIGTGSYSSFWKDFYSSSEEYFLLNHLKHYFVFTDDKSIKSNDNITTIFKKCEGFPNDSLFRFKIFLKIKSELEKFDYIFFFNSNMKFITNVDDSFLPKNNLFENGLLGVLHPGHYNKSVFWYPYDRNSNSKAFIPFKINKSYHYFMGGVNGGRSFQYLKLIETCANNIDEDLKEGYIAKYHDESHLNKYFYENKCKIVGPEYGWIEGKITPLHIKIIIRDKTKINTKFKKQSTNILIRIINLFFHINNSFMWIIFS